MSKIFYIFANISEIFPMFRTPNGSIFSLPILSFHEKCISHLNSLGEANKPPSKVVTSFAQNTFSNVLNFSLPLIFISFRIFYSKEGNSRKSEEYY